MNFINKFIYLGKKIMKGGKYSLYLNKVRKNLAAADMLLLHCSTTGAPDRYVPVGDLGRFRSSSCR